MRFVAALAVVFLCFAAASQQPEEWAVRVLHVHTHPALLVSYTIIDAGGALDRGKP